MKKSDELRKKKLRPGMWVRNVLTGRKGMVRADPKNPRRLMIAHSDFVQIVVFKAKTLSKNAVQLVRDYRTWYLPNIRICSGF